MCICVYAVCIFRPQWMALCIPPDLILTVLEGMTAIIHYCLLDPTSQYHQVRELVSHACVSRLLNAECSGLK